MRVHFDFSGVGAVDVVAVGSVDGLGAGLVLLLVFTSSGLAAGGWLVAGLFLLGVSGAAVSVFVVVLLAAASFDCTLGSAGVAVVDSVGVVVTGVAVAADVLVSVSVVFSCCCCIHYFEDFSPAPKR